MKKYVLICCNESSNYERKYSDSLKELKEWVSEERSENYLPCEMYIRNQQGRVFKRYKAIVPISLSEYK